MLQCLQRVVQAVGPGCYDPASAYWDPNTHESHESCSQLLSVAEGMVMLSAQCSNAGE